tara:strand:+ start:13352 stop:14473 length:1122 start_codon:yes stop_codon:yes gene_type:complete
MAIASSPSDYTSIDVDYSTGKGYYTDKGAVSDMLQIPAFSSSTFPSQAQVGSIIKNIEGIVDDKVKRSYRPIIHKNEFHNFEFMNHPMQTYYGGYVGFIQLATMKVKKIVSLKVWQGNSYLELASAQASITLNSDNYKHLRSITLQLPNSGSSWILYFTGEGGTNANNTFNSSFGSKTMAQEICHLINEEYPANTAQFTGASTEKFKNSEADSSIAISDFFYASTDPDDGNKINISSLLAGEDGSACTITLADKAGENSSSITEAFTDKQDMKRLGSFWKIGDEGRVFFLRDYPYHTQNSIIASYIAGDGRVPSAIHKATTMLVAAELLRHDDQTIMIAETGGNISTKEKYDILTKEANDILKGKGDLVYLLE